MRANGTGKTERKASKRLVGNGKEWTKLRSNEMFYYCVGSQRIVWPGESMSVVFRNGLDSVWDSRLKKKRSLDFSVSLETAV